MVKEVICTFFLVALLIPARAQDDSSIWMYYPTILKDYKKGHSEYNRYFDIGVNKYKEYTSSMVACGLNYGEREMLFRTVSTAITRKHLGIDPTVYNDYKIGDKLYGSLGEIRDNWRIPELIDNSQYKDYEVSSNVEENGLLLIDGLLFEKFSMILTPTPLSFDVYGYPNYRKEDVDENGNLIMDTARRAVPINLESLKWLEQWYLDNNGQFRKEIRGIGLPNVMKNDHQDDHVLFFNAPFL